MCRSIRPLHNFAPPATAEETHAAALQYVRKISGATRPSRANARAFERAVDEVALATRRLLDALVTTAAAAQPRGRSRPGAGTRRAALRPGRRTDGGTASMTPAAPTVAIADLEVSVDDLDLQFAPPPSSTSTAALWCAA